MDRLPRLPWRVLAGLACALIGLGLGWLWFRDSSFAEVEQRLDHRQHALRADQVRDALTSAADGMSTLHVDARRSSDAVEPFTSVADLRVRADFPHDLRIEVDRARAGRRPSRAAGAASRPRAAGSSSTASARTTCRRSSTSAPAPRDGRVQDRTRSPRSRSRPPRRPSCAPAPSSCAGATTAIALDLRDGPGADLRQAASAARTKWTAAARVLAEDSSAGATYLDLRVPKLVAAGGVGPITPGADRRRRPSYHQSPQP